MVYFRCQSDVIFLLHFIGCGFDSSPNWRRDSTQDSCFSVSKRIDRPLRFRIHSGGASGPLIYPLCFGDSAFIQVTATFTVRELVD